MTFTGLDTRSQGFHYLLFCHKSQDNMVHTVNSIASRLTYWKSTWISQSGSSMCVLHEIGMFMALLTLGLYSDENDYTQSISFSLSSYWYTLKMWTTTNLQQRLQRTINLPAIQHYSLYLWLILIHDNNNHITRSHHHMANRNDTARGNSTVAYCCSISLHT